MKGISLLRLVGLRIGVGLGISVLGILISWIVGDWKISFTYFTLFGTILLVFAAFPYALGSKRAERRVRTVLNRRIDMGVTSHSKEEAANWSITMGIIGAVNVILPVIVYYLLIYTHLPRT